MREDQAQGLRQLFARRRCHVAAVCGHQGSRLAVSVAGSLGAMGYRVCVLDRSFGEAARAVGRRAKYDLAQVLDGDCTLEQAMLSGAEHVAVLPASRGLDRLGAESADWQAGLGRAVPEMSARFDLWLVNGLLPGHAPDAPMLLAVNPSTQAITNAYGQIKALASAQGRRRFGVVVHAAASAATAQRAFDCIADAARRFLGAELELYGWLPAVVAASTVADDPARSHAAAYTRIAARLMADLATPPLLRTGS
ncbi:MAG: hypothetical protein ABI920_00620 [Casimicrobiaceae bacterium]